jgi:hypothetical protein
LAYFALFICGVFAIAVLGKMADGGSRASVTSEASPKPTVICNDIQRKSASKIFATMNGPPEMSHIEESEDGNVSVTFSGMAYAQMTAQTVDAMVTAIANADACITGKARRLFFYSPSGKMIAKADEVFGITVY